MSGLNMSVSTIIAMTEGCAEIVAPAMGPIVELGRSLSDRALQRVQNKCCRQRDVRIERFGERRKGACD